MCPLGGLLTHCIRNTLPHYILEESNFNFRYTWLWDLHILREKWLNYLQTVETLIRHHILLCLIWVCTVCQVPFYGSPDYNGLSWQFFFLHFRGGGDIPAKEHFTWLHSLEVLLNGIICSLEQFFSFKWSSALRKEANTSSQWPPFSKVSISFKTWGQSVLQTHF